jgi:hypothetical protein
MLHYIPLRPDYETWTRVISAVGAALPADEAASVLNEWSPEERRGEYAEKLRNRLQTVGVATLVYLAKQGGYDASTAARRRMDGTAPPARPRPAQRVAQRASKVKVIQWPSDMHAGTVAELEALAKLRGIPGLDGLEMATAAGHLWFATMNDLEGDKWTPRAAWLLTDRTRRIALARRLDGMEWRHVRAKGWLLRGSQGNCPIGAPEIGDMPNVMLTEGGPDFLCAWHSIATSGEDWAPVCMASASARIPEETLPCFAGRTVLIMMHNDDAGRNAEAVWGNQLCAAGADVWWFNFARWRDRVTGKTPNDLNDFLRANADDTLEKV